MANAAEAEFDETQVDGVGSLPEGGSTQGGRSLKLRKPLLAALGVAAVLALGGGGYYAYATFFPGEDSVAVEPPVFVDLPQIVVNLVTDDARTQYLRINISLEVADKKLAESITPMMPRVLDAFQVHLRELRPDDLEGSAALYRLKEELLRRINASVYPAQVNAILFREFLIQ